MNRLSVIFKLGLLYAALTALLIAVGYLIGGQGAIPYFLAFALIFNVITYWFSDKIALMMAHAQPLPESQAPEIYEDVRDLCHKMHLPVPQIYISNEMQPNAFATGRNPSHSVVCVTRGLLQVLNRNEIKAVLGHELGHVRHYDVLLATVAAVIAGTVSSLANIGGRILLFGGNSDRRQNNAGNLFLLLVSPIVAVLIQLAISRSREYSADDNSAQVTGKPEWLADALIKISQGTKQVPMNVNPSLSSLFIANPFPRVNFMELFSTHPSIDNRVRRLLEKE